MGSNNTLETEVIFFDGYCNLCNGAVNFILDRDHKKRYKFASLQSEEADKIIPKELQSVDSIVLYRPQNKTLIKSNAALEIARHLSGLWPVLYIFKVLPRSLRDLVYEYIAKKRYKWFGKRDHCRVPTPDIKERFLES